MDPKQTRPAQPETPRQPEGDVLGDDELEAVVGGVKNSAEGGGAKAEVVTEKMGG